MGDKTYKCRYAFCPYPDKAIHPEDNCKKVGRLYFHAGCYEKKQKGEWKDSRTKADLQESSPGKTIQASKEDSPPSGKWG